MKKFKPISTLFISLFLVLLLLVSCGKKAEEKQKVDNKPPSNEVHYDRTDTTTHRAPANIYRRVEAPVDTIETLTQPYKSRLIELVRDLPKKDKRGHGKDTGLDLEKELAKHEEELTIIAWEKEARSEEMKNSSWYNRLNFEKVYGQKNEPPELDFTVDLSSASLEDLRIMRNQVFATKGYLFKNSIVRGYFNKYKWYQPIYWEDHEITLTDEEKEFINRCQVEEKKRLTENYIEVDGLHLANVENVINKEQFENIPENLWEKLRTDNFVRVANEHSMFYQLYDEAQYNSIPKFVTTDAYQHLLHVYYSKLLRDVEKKSLLPILKEIIYQLYGDINSDNNQLQDDQKNIVEAIRKNRIVLAVAGNLLDANLTQCDDPEYLQIFNKAKMGNGIGCSLLGEPFYDFSQLQPRGTYTNDPEIAGYFRSLKWLLTAPIKIETAIGRAQAIILAYHISKDKDLLRLFEAFAETLNLFAGKGDDPSLLDLAQIIQEDYKRLSIPELLEEKTATRIIIKLKQEKQARIIARNSMDPDQNRNALFIFPSTYTVDAEIHQRLTQPVNNPYNNGFRLIPKGLDIFASFGNDEAENILLNEYKENETWSAFSDTLEILKNDMPSLLEESQTSLYGRRMDLFLSLDHEDENAPGFMKTPAWDRQQLNSALAGWTELAHEMILYRKQAIMAEGGQGGGLPEPVIPGYVDPNLEYWKKCVELLDYTKISLDKIGYDIPGVHSRIQGIGKELMILSWKELNGDYLTDAEFDWIHWIGSHLSYAERAVMSHFKVETDRMAIVTDVASYIDENLAIHFLQEAVGNTHELYAVVEINGLLYLTIGAVSTYYEFIQPGPTRLTDERWREMLRKKEILQPEWIKSIYVDSPPLKSKRGYARMSRPVSSKW